MMSNIEVAGQIQKATSVTAWILLAVAIVSVVAAAASQNITPPCFTRDTLTICTPPDPGADLLGNSRHADYIRRHEALLAVDWKLLQEQGVINKGLLAEIKKLQTRVAALEKGNK